MSEPAPSPVPAGWWECIGLGDGAGPNAIMTGGETPAHPARNETSSAPNSLFPELRTATPFSSSVQQGAQTGAPLSGSWFNSWSWAGAADQRWARGPRRSRLGMQRLRGVIHLFHRHCQPQQIFPYYHITGAEEGLKSDRYDSVDHSRSSDYDKKISSRKIQRRVASLSRFYGRMSLQFDRRK